MTVIAGGGDSRVLDYEDGRHLLEGVAPPDQSHATMGVDVYPASSAA
jgi:hypothetical protein